jgi:hypothetical protein
MMVIALSALGGVFGFVGGIAWCLVDYPDSPQAPLFGILITGPIGLFLGVIASLWMILWATTSNDAEKERPKAPPHSN